MIAAAVVRLWLLFSADNEADEFVDVLCGFSCRFVDCYDVSCGC